MISIYPSDSRVLLERKSVMSKFAERLREARLKRGLSQSQLAEKLGITQPQMSGYERGVSLKPDVFVEILKVLNVSSDYLLGLSDDYLPLSGKERELIRVYRNDLAGLMTFIEQDLNDRLENDVPPEIAG